MWREKVFVVSPLKVWLWVGPECSVGGKIFVWYAGKRHRFKLWAYFTFNGSMRIKLFNLRWLIAVATDFWPSIITRKCSFNRNYDCYLGLQCHVFLICHLSSRVETPWQPIVWNTAMFQWGGDKSVNLKNEVNKRQNNTRLQPSEQRLKLHNSIFLVHLFHSQNVRSLNFNNYVCISVMLLFANLLYLLFDCRRVRNSLLIISHPTG